MRSEILPLAFRQLLTTSIGRVRKLLAGAAKYVIQRQVVKPFGSLGDQLWQCAEAIELALADVPVLLDFGDFSYFTRHAESARALHRALRSSFGLVPFLSFSNVHRYKILLAALLRSRNAREIKSNVAKRDSTQTFRTSSPSPQCLTLMRSALCSEASLSPPQSALLSRIRSTTSVGIHLPAAPWKLHDSDDLMWPALFSKDFIAFALSEARRIPNAVFFLFSDDPDWAISWLGEGLSIERTELITVETPSNLFLLSECKHQIVSPTPFGWWAARLSASNEPQVWTSIGASTFAQWDVASIPHTWTVWSGA